MTTDRTFDLDPRKGSPSPRLLEDVFIILTPVNWYQTSSPLKLMIDRGLRG